MPLSPKGELGLLVNNYIISIHISNTSVNVLYWYAVQISYTIHNYIGEHEKQMSVPKITTIKLRAVVKTNDASALVPL
jgi:hypothetical protein